jgi:predicted Zn-dependent peptidase
MGRESALARAEQAATQVLLFGRALEAVDLAASIDAVTPATLDALLDRILAPRRAAVAVLGPRAAMGAAEGFTRALFG